MTLHILFRVLSVLGAAASASVASGSEPPPGPLSAPARALSERIRGTPLAVAFPDGLRACIWCQNCGDPDTMHTWEIPDGSEILWIQTMGCENYNCGNAIPCESEEQDQLAFAELSGVVALGEGEMFHQFVQAHPGRVDILPERNLILLRGNCANDYIALWEVTSEQMAGLQVEPDVAVAFQNAP